MDIQGLHGYILSKFITPDEVTEPLSVPDVIVDISNNLTEEDVTEETLTDEADYSEDEESYDEAAYDEDEADADL